MGRLERALLVVAGLYGAAGVGLAAAGSHTEAENVSIAADFLLFHAVALIGLVALKATPARLRQAALIVLAAGTFVFAGDLVLGHYAEDVDIPFAAPVGGSALIVGWLLVALAAALGFRRRA